jgi:integrase
MTLLDSATGDLYVLLLLGATTGMRLGDCCTLKWSEVDLIRRIIRRVPNKTARRKSSKQVVIGIPEQLFYTLQERENKTGYVLPEFAKMYNRDKNHSNLEKQIRKHFESCGIKCHREGTGKGTDKRAVVEVGFHSLRHTYVSLHAERGTPAAIIQGNVGHGSPAMTAHYTHISDSAAVEVAQVLDFTSPTDQDAPETVTEPRREQLKQLADTLSLEDIERILAYIKEKK